MRRPKLDEVTSLPEYVAGFTEDLGLQTEFRLDDGANHKLSICHVLTEHAPQVDSLAAIADIRPWIGMFHLERMVVRGSECFISQKSAARSVAREDTLHLVT